MLCAWSKGRTAEIEKVVEDAFEIGFPSPTILSLLGVSKKPVEGESEFVAEARQVIDRMKVQPVFKMVDTCAGEFESATPYYYGTFEDENDQAAVLSRL